MATELVPLGHWDNFYVVVGSAAGALTGLQFVVIALQQDVTTNIRHAVRAFGTPTIVHFSAVLSLSAVLSMPRHTRASLAWTVLVIATGLLAYVGWVFRKAREQNVYQPDLEDWVFHYFLPAVAYLSMIAAGVTAWRAANTALYLIASGVLLLLIVGIHNAWDAAVYIMTRRSDQQNGA